MSNDDSEIIDVEAEEIEETSNVPAVVSTPVRTYRSEEPIRQDRDWPRQDRDWPHGPSPDRRCVAHRKNGDRCKNAAIRGATVCRYHGGAAKHVKAAARARLENAADLMAKELLGIALTADGESVKLAAIRDALDRAGLRPPAEVVLSQGETKAYETVFDSIGGTGPEESLDLDTGYGPAGHEGLWLAQPDLSAPDQPPPSFTCPPTRPHPARENTGAPQHQQADPSSPGGPLRQAATGDDDRERDAQPRREASSQRTPAPRDLHITGMAAIRMANEANRESGVFDEQRAIESPHKRYRRP